VFDREESETYVGLLFAEKTIENIRDVFSDTNAEEMGFPAKVLIQRLKLADVKINVALALWITCLSKSPGELVMHAWTLREIYYSRPPEDWKPLGITDWGRYFLHGVPTKEMFDFVWSSQKTVGAPNGNGLYQSEVWKAPLPDAAHTP
jgi:hypothetical protein